MNGYEFARTARKTNPASETALIALTGYGRDDDQKNAVKAGFDAHLVKPLNSEMLYSIIATMLTSDQRHQTHAHKPNVHPKTAAPPKVKGIDASLRDAQLSIDTNSHSY